MAVLLVCAVAYIGEFCAYCSKTSGSERLLTVLQIHSAAGPHQVGTVPW